MYNHKFKLTKSHFSDTGWNIPFCTNEEKAYALVHIAFSKRWSYDAFYFLEQKLNITLPSPNELKNMDYQDAICFCQKLLKGENNG